MKNLNFSPRTTVLAAAVTAATLSFSGAASAIPMASFSIDGDTAFESFSISNGSNSGELVTGFHLNISSTGACFDVTDLPTDACPGNANNGLLEFAARNGSDLITGLLPPSVNDGDTILDFLFSDFNAGEYFVWDLDVDAIGGGTNGTILGNQLIGATAWFDFSNGDRLFGTLAGVENNPDASAFSVVGVPRLQPIEEPDPDPVPVPSTLALFALAALGVFRRDRKAA